MVEGKTKRKPDTRKGDRHRPGYWVDYLRKRRAKLKALKDQPTPSIPKPSY